MTTWVVVASTARARVFELPKNHARATEIADFVNPEGRMADRDVLSDKPGRSFDSVGGQRHSLGKSVDPKQQQARRFAKKVVEFVQEGLRTNRFSDACVVAEPHFLGLLREQMGTALSRTIVEEVSKDLTRFDFESVRDHLVSLN